MATVGWFAIVTAGVPEMVVDQGAPPWLAVTAPLMVSPFTVAAWTGTMPRTEVETVPMTDTPSVDGLSAHVRPRDPETTTVLDMPWSIPPET